MPENLLLLAAPPQSERRLHLQELPGYRRFDPSRRALEEIMHVNAVREYFASLPDEPSKPVPHPYTHYLSSEWEDFILHDTKGTATLLVGLDMVKGFAKKLSAEDDMVLSHFSTELAHVRELDKYVSVPIGVKIESLNSLMGVFRENLLHRKFDLPEEAKSLEKLINGAKTTAMIWPMLYHTANTLNSVATRDDVELERNIYKLKDTRVYVRDVIKKAGSENNVIVAGLKGKVQIDGVKGIILYNLVKNASRHAIMGVQIKFTGDEITISNDSHDPVMSDNLFEPGKPGANGNTGFGLFTIRNILGALGGYDVVLNSGSDKDTGPLYHVSFTIKPTTVFDDPPQK